MRAMRAILCPRFGIGQNQKPGEIMNTAQEFVKKSAMAKNIKAFEKQAFEACKYYKKDAQGFGWGDAEIWEFSDGSAMIYDGRGFTATEYA